MPTLSSRRGDYALPHLMRWSERATWPELPPVPLIDPHTKIAAIGSCFAERVTEVLSARGLPATFHTGGLVYTTFTIVQELQHLFGDDPYRDEDLCQERDGTFSHPFRKAFRAESRKALLDQQAAADAIARAAYREAGLVIMTLGLTETWRRTRDGLVAVELPTPEAVERGEFVFSRSTAAENLANLEAAYKILRTVTKAPLLLTVSPVPLSATFRPGHVTVNNCESKSVLRAAAADFLAAHQDAHYFHSYELVAANSAGVNFFLDDGRHVTPDGVGFIMNEFLRMYGTDALRPAFQPFGDVPLPDQTLRKRFSNLRGRVMKRVRQARGLEG